MKTCFENSDLHQKKTIDHKCKKNPTPHKINIQEDTFTNTNEWTNQVKLCFGQDELNLPILNPHRVKLRHHWNQPSHVGQNSPLFSLLILHIHAHWEKKKLEKYILIFSQFTIVIKWIASVNNRVYISAIIFLLFLYFLQFNPIKPYNC